MSSDEADQSSDSPRTEEQEEKGSQEEIPQNGEATAAEDAARAQVQTEEVTEEQATVVTASEETSTEVQSEDGAAEQSGEEEGPRKLTVDDIQTAPIDFRFPTTNQARHCFTRYIEYHKCIRDKGEEAPECNKYARYYRSLCPGEWIDRWNEQREAGTFPGPL